jgi:hypothetical protein
MLVIHIIQRLDLLKSDILLWQGNFIDGVERLSPTLICCMFLPCSIKLTYEGMLRPFVLKMTPQKHNFHRGKAKGIGIKNSDAFVFILHKTISCHREQ